MKDKIQTYLDEVCACIRCKKVHSAVRAELESHLLDSAARLEQEGLSHANAVDQALRQMGSSTETGKSLDAQHAPQTEWWLLLLVGLLAAAGTAVLFLTGGAGKPGLAHHFLALLAGAVLMTGLCFFDYTRLEKYAKMAYPLLLVLVPALFLLFPQTINGRAYTGLFGISLSLTYFMPAYLLAFAGMLSVYRGSIRRLLRLSGLALASVVIYAALGYVSTALPLAACYFVLLTLSVLRGDFQVDHRKYFACCGLGAAGIVALAALHPGVQSRLQTFFTRGSTDPQGSGWVTRVCDGLFQNSHWFGAAQLPLDGGVYSAAQILPAGATDFVLVNVIATLGKFAGVALVLLAALFLLRLVHTTAKVRNPFGFYLCAACCCYFVFAFTASIGVNLGFLPFFSVPMPFFSLGGIQSAQSLALAGVILSVWRRNRQAGAVMPDC